MHRKTEYSIGVALGAAALVIGVAAGCASNGSGGKSPTAGGSTTGSPLPSQSVSVVTLPAAASSSATAGATDVAAGTPSKCSTNDLSGYVSIVPNSAGMGNELMNVKLTNTSGHTCTIYGYPGFQLEDKNQSNLPTNVVRTSGTEQTITVPNGDSAATTVRFDFDVPGAGDNPTGPCQPESYYTQITPPDQTTQLVAQIQGGPVTVCQSGEMQVLPFVSGPTGPNQ
ncbi:MAG TPA: DUF4232 domain-containing protein [Actinocrinis sp.]|jgi:hypothetical protein